MPNLNTPTTELEAVNIMLSGIGESPVNSLSASTADISIARSVLFEVSKAVQLDGFQWNTEDDYPLTPNTNGEIPIHPNIIRVAFREPDDRELTIRGRKVYNRVEHTFKFASDTAIYVTVTLILPFEELPEAARRYIAIRALRVFQERVVGSDTLSKFQQQDEYRARQLMMLEERKLDRPNMLTGTFNGHATWRPVSALMHRGVRRWR